MSLSAEQVDRLHDSLCALRDNRIEPSELEFLQSLVVADAEARRLFVRAMHLRASMLWKAKQGLVPPADSTSAAQADTTAGSPSSLQLPGVPPLATSRPQTPLLGFLGTVVNFSAAWLSSPKSLAITVIGGLATYFVGLMISIAISRAFVTDRSAQQRTDLAAAAPARIVAASDCRWQDRWPTADRVGVLPAGTSHLVSGVVELEFDGGARVRIEGPAEFAPRSGQRMQLTRGRLMAYVPKQARGFTIDTPSAEVVDLGTEFGVEVDGQGSTDLHVIRGRVEVKPADKTRMSAQRGQQIIAGTAIRLSVRHAAAEPIPFNDARFDTVRSALARDDKSTSQRNDGAPIPLESATATFSQAGHAPGQAIDGVTAGENGWAISPKVGAGQTIIFKTVAPVATAGTLTFILAQNFNAGGFTENLGHFQLSATTDGGSTWNVLAPASVTDFAGSTFQVLDDNSILVSGVNPTGGESYTVVAPTALVGIDGFRLDALTDSSLPFNGPGREGGNFVLTEFQASIASLPEPNGLPPAAPPKATQADAAGNPRIEVESAR